MTKISVSGGVLTVEIQGLHQLWAFTRSIRVPMAHVRGATADPGIVHEPKGLRAPGIHVPGAVIGTFRRDGETHFWDVRSGAQAVVIELTDENYDRLIVDVEDPRHTVDVINDAVQIWSASGSPAAEFAQTPQHRWMTRTQWKAALAGAVVIECAFKAAMLVDIERRPTRDLRGSKSMWRVLAFIHFLGPLAYFAAGRRHRPARCTRNL